MKFLMKIISFVFLITSIVGLVYLLIDLSNNKDIVTVYNKVGSSKSVNINGMKKLNFLSTYVKETGEYGVAIMKGYDDTSLTNYEDEQNNDEESDEGTGNNGNVGFASSKTKQGFIDALKERGNDVYFADGKGYSIYEINGNAYLREVQARGFMRTCRNGFEWVYNDEGKITNSSIDGVGCYLFSIINAANNMLGSTYSVVELVPYIVSNNGDTGGYNNSLVWDSAANVWSPRVTDSKGVVHNRPLYLNLAGNWYNFGAATKFLNSIGLNFLTITNQFSDLTLSGVSNKLSELGFDNCVYILYCHTENTSSGGCHWQVCVGVNEDGTMNIIDNENAPNATSVTSTEAKNNICTEGVPTAVSVVIKIYK